MARKLGLLLAAVGVFAFTVPVMANAAVPTLQDSAGNPLKAGTTIVSTGSDVVFTSNILGALTCSSMTLQWTLSVNDMTNGITGSNSGEIPNVTDCTNGTQTINYTKVTITDLKSAVGGEALMSYVMEVDFGTTRCVFTGTNVKGTYTNGGDVLTFTKATGITGTPLACGTTQLDGSFTLEQSGGAALKFAF